MAWAPVPSGFAHGVVLGYHILYRRSNDSNTSHVIETTHAYNFTYVLRMLNKYTEYKIQMMAFTKKGNGSVSDEISVYTAEDSMYYSSFLTIIDILKITVIYLAF